MLILELEVEATGHQLFEESRPDTGSEYDFVPDPFPGHLDIVKGGHGATVQGLCSGSGLSPGSRAGKNGTVEVADTPPLLSGDEDHRLMEMGTGPLLPHLRRIFLNLEMKTGDDHRYIAREAHSG